MTVYLCFLHCFMYFKYICYCMENGQDFGFIQAFLYQKHIIFMEGNRFSLPIVFLKLQKEIYLQSVLYSKHLFTDKFVMKKDCCLIYMSISTFFLGFAKTAFIFANNILILIQKAYLWFDGFITHMDIPFFHFGFTKKALSICLKTALL